MLADCAAEALPGIQVQSASAMVRMCARDMAYSNPGAGLVGELADCLDGEPVFVLAATIKDTKQFAGPVGVGIASAGTRDRERAAEARVGARRVAQPRVGAAADRPAVAVDREACRDG